MAAFFGPAQILLADPERQSAKFFALFYEIEPLPRIVQDPWILAIALPAFGAIYASVYVLIARGLPGGAWWRRGLGFGFAAWALSFLWFEFFFPWNIGHEPISLVILELVCWLAVTCAVGLAAAIAYRYDQLEARAG